MKALKRNLYRRYTGRRPNVRKIVLRLLLVVAALALLTFAAYQYFQDYLVFSADGVRIELPGFLSFLQRKEEPEPPDDEFHFVIDPSDDEQDAANVNGNEADDPPEENSPPEEPTPAGRLPLRAVWLPVERLAEKGYLEEMISLYRSGFISGVVIDLKEISGKLTYPTQTETGVALGVSEDASDRVIDAIQTLSEEGLYLIGRMSACRDNIAPALRRGWGIKTTGGVSWLDRKNIRWLSLYEEQAVDYLAALADEAAGLPVDELMIENLSFPYEGKLNLIAYGDETENSRAEAVERAAERLARREDGLRVSVVLTAETARSGEDAAAGQRVSALADITGSIFFEGTAAEAADGFAGYSEPLKEAAAEKQAICLLSVNSKKQAAAGTSALWDAGFILMREDGTYTAEDFQAP